MKTKHFDYNHVKSVMRALNFSDKDIKASFSDLLDKLNLSSTSDIFFEKNDLDLDPKQRVYTPLHPTNQKLMAGVVGRKLTHYFDPYSNPSDSWKELPASKTSVTTENKMQKIRLGDLKRIVYEALMREDAAKAEQETGDSLDVQVDMYLAQYEDEANDNLASKNESIIDFRTMTRRFLSEAGQDDDKDKGDEAEDAEPDEQAPSKLTLENIDIEAFVNSVVRLVDNYDSLLEIKNTLVRRAKNFLSKSYDEETVSTFERVLREDHGIVPGQSSSETSSEEFQPPPGANAGPDIAAGTP